VDENRGTTVGNQVKRHRAAKMLGAALSASLLLAACGGGDDNEKTQATKTSEPSARVNNHGTKDLSGKPSADIELDDFYFEPTVLKGKPGQSITLNLENEGKVEHNFSLAEQQIDQDVEKGEKATVDLTFPKSGTLRFICKYHEAKGMAGTLGVSGSSGDSAAAPSSDGGGSAY
jgi:plastocyanin